MTTERKLQIAALVFALPLAWLALAAGIAWLRSEPRIVAVIGPPAAGMKVLAAAGQPLVAAGPWAVTTRVEGPAAVRRLYAAGAWLVVEGNAGCNWFAQRPR